MPKRKAARNAEIKPWLSAKIDCREGRFIQVGNSFLLSKEAHDLSAGARWLYLCMAVESGGKREVTFTHGTGKKYGVASTSFDRYAKELRVKGFIEQLPTENLAQYAPTTYRFIFDWKSCAKSAPQNGEGGRGNLPQSGEGIST